MESFYYRYFINVLNSAHGLLSSMASMLICDKIMLVKDLYYDGDDYLQDSVYYVQIRDNQGNVRAVIDQDRRLVETTHYYPYGGLINAGDNQLQPHKYGAKELDRENGLDLYDFSARMYDPMLPQFTGVDILSERKPWNSSFAYCEGNSINRKDISL